MNNNYEKDIETMSRLRVKMDSDIYYEAQEFSHQEQLTASKKYYKILSNYKGHQQEVENAVIQKINKKHADEMHPIIKSLLNTLHLS